MKGTYIFLADDFEEIEALAIVERLKGSNLAAEIRSSMMI